MTDYSKDDRVVSICTVCGTEWIARGEPSEEGTQMMVQRCYCDVDMSFDRLDKLILGLLPSDDDPQNYHG